MDKKRRSRTPLIIVAILLLLLVILLWRGCSGSTETPSTDVGPTQRPSTESSPTESTSSEPADLVGRWDGSSSVLGEFSIIIDRTAPVPDTDENSQYVSGYITFGEDPSVTPFAPLSGISFLTGDGLYDLQIWSTSVGPSGESMEEEEDQALPILFTGSLNTEEGEVVGQWESGEEVGDWQMTHQAEEAPKPPSYNLEKSGLWIDYDVTVSIHTADQNSTIDSHRTQLDLTTNVAVSTVVVLMPDGTETTLERFTDIFSPGVEFVSEFRFAAGVDGTAAEGDYVFRFLDPMGDVLAGIEGVDVWGGCEALAPLNVQGSVGANGIMVSWSPVPGFDPADPNGFYQIELGPDSSEGKKYGSNHIQQNSHLMPFASFMPGTFGVPDGADYGVGLSQLEDGFYKLAVYVFIPANEGAGGVGFECQVLAEDEVVLIEKNGENFTIN